MTKYTDFINSEFPTIDDNFKGYLEDVLKYGGDDIKNSEDMYEAIGDVLKEISPDKTEDDIRLFCINLLDMLKNKQSPDSISNQTEQSYKVLNAPVHIGPVVDTVQPTMETLDSIWTLKKDFSLKVDLNKLERAEARILRKQEKKTKEALSKEEEEY